MKLTWKSFDRAKDFIYWHARPLEKAIFSYYFKRESGENVLAELSKFQNQDGGFGNALEPDVRLPDSSVIATTVGLQVLREMGVPQNYYVVKEAIQYLLKTYDAENGGWEQVPPNVDKYPHAPWWNYDGVTTSLNPVAEIVGYFFDYAGLVSEEMRDNLLSKVISQIDEKADSMEMHELLCCVRLVETKALPKDVKSDMIHKLKKIVDLVVAKNPSDWDGYVLKPSMLLSSPDSTFAEMLAHEIEANLEYEIEHQNEDGSWLPNFSWGGIFPEVWEKIQTEWKGFFTVRNLILLNNFGHIEK